MLRIVIHSGDGLTSAIIWACALLVMDGETLPKRLRPTPLGCVLGTALILWVLMRSPTLLSVMPLITGIALALLARPWREMGRFAPVLLILALLAPMRLLVILTPVAKLSEITAWLSEMLLVLCGVPVQRQGHAVLLPGGGVSVAGPCSGISIIVQVLLVALIFMVAFPMRHRWQNVLMVSLAPLLAWLVNGVRISVLALITASSWSGKLWWFDFFHHSWGSHLFAGLAMVVFIALYVHWQGRQVARLSQLDQR
ncbi:MAG: archaeosortase/exosortase family protein [Cyanobium sp.]